MALPTREDFTRLHDELGALRTDLIGRLDQLIALQETAMGVPPGNQPVSSLKAMRATLQKLTPTEDQP